MIDPAELVNMSKEDRKQHIGEKLYPVVSQFCDPNDAGKVTGMILELENDELIDLLQNSQQIKEKVNEALGVLKNHPQQPQEIAQN